MRYGLDNIVVCVVRISFKMGGLFSTVSKRVKQRAVTEFLTHESETPIEIYKCFLAFYGEDTVDVSAVCHWVRKSRDSGRNVNVKNQPRSGRSDSSTHYVNRQKVDELIHKNRRITQRAIAEKLNIGLSRVNETIAGLAYKKVCARWVPRQLMSEINRARLEACQQLLSHYKSEGNDFVYSIVTGDKSWVYHYDSELKSQSLEYRHPTYSRNKCPRLSLSLENACSHFSGTTVASFTRSTWSKVRESTPRLT
jgi:hypothetical protein